MCTPEDAFRCFVFTNIDYLVLGSFLIDKSDISNEIKNKFNKPLLIDD